MENTLLNILISELKIYCGPDKLYGWSKFGQYDEVNNRAPLFDFSRFKSYSKWCPHLSRSIFLYFNYLMGVTAGGPVSPRGQM